MSVKFKDSLSKAVGGGGGTGGSKPPASRTLQSRLPPLFSWLPPFCPFAIAKYYAMLRNFPLFLPLPTLLELSPPALSSPASRTPPAPYSPGLPPPCLPPQSNCIKISLLRRRCNGNCWEKYTQATDVYHQKKIFRKTYSTRFDAFSFLRH